MDPFPPLPPTVFCTPPTSFVQRLTRKKWPKLGFSVAFAWPNSLCFFSSFSHLPKLLEPNCFQWVIEGGCDAAAAGTNRNRRNRFKKGSTSSSRACRCFSFSSGEKFSYGVASHACTFKKLIYMLYYSTSFWNIQTTTMRAWNGKVLALLGLHASNGRHHPVCIITWIEQMGNSVCRCNV